MSWLHKLLHPHCPHCIEAAREARVCNTCEVLKDELLVLRAEHRQLLNRMAAPSLPISTSPENQVNYTPRVTEPARGPIPWRVKQQMLEDEDRAKAKVMKQYTEANAKLMTKEEVNKLEQELLKLESEDANK